MEQPPRGGASVGPRCRRRPAGQQLAQAADSVQYDADVAERVPLVSMKGAE